MTHKTIDRALSLLTSLLVTALFAALVVSFIESAANDLAGRLDTFQEINR